MKDVWKTILAVNYACNKHTTLYSPTHATTPSYMYNNTHTLGIALSYIHYCSLKHTTTLLYSHYSFFYDRIGKTRCTISPTHTRIYSILYNIIQSYTTTECVTVCVSKYDSCLKG